MNLSTQIIVIGAGHAGVEAALAAARLGCDTVLFTLSLDTIANMPCNPSIGGTGKGHLVYEIDALGGEMGRVADAVTLQSRTLNLGKGAAVQSKRIQADRRRYSALMKRTLERTPNLRLVQGEVVELLTEPGNDGRPHICGIVTRIGERWACKAVVIATGTYLDGRVFVGDRNYAAGPDGLLPARGLSDSLRALGITLMRFKTGTPARVKQQSVDLSVLEVQPGEVRPIPYCADTPEDAFDSLTQLPCHIVYTNAETHRIIRKNIGRSAMYSGQIHGTGPRYCPSIEDKLVRFADKERHQLFVEPMGAETDELYIQGFSTSLPPDVQHAMLRSLDGFAHAEIMRYAYAIEYDCADPTQMTADLAFRAVRGLYGAGQFNGTSGYEEAAAQGLVAGINAARLVQGREPLLLPRASSYIGTLIDDLVTKGTNEPYRMMTSRSEYRLLLRQDNADQRLTPIGRKVGLISDARWAAYTAKQEQILAACTRLESIHLSPTEANNRLLAALGQPALETGISLADLLRRPGIDYASLAPLDPGRPPLSRRVTASVEITIKYAGYIKRQLAEVKRLEKREAFRLPADLDYAKITGLRIEAAQKLQKLHPLTLGQATRISGVSPADIGVLMIYLGIK